MTTVEQGDAIAELQEAMTELRQQMQTVVDATHATIHLLAYLYTMRCLSSPDPIAEYKFTATTLLGSLGAGNGEDALPSYGDAERDAIARGIRHHVGQFLLSLQSHVEANVKPEA